MKTQAQAWRQASTIRHNQNITSLSTLALPGRQEHVITVSGRSRDETIGLLNAETNSRRAQTLHHFNFGGGRRFGALVREHGHLACAWPAKAGHLNGGQDFDELSRADARGPREMASKLAPAKCSEAGMPALTEGFWSLQTVALSGMHITLLQLPGPGASGVIYEDKYARYCRLTSLTPPNGQAPRAEQARALFELLATTLQSQGFHFTDTVRTWYYLDNLLDWYDEFNAARTSFFTEQGIFDKLLPASTGVSMSNPWDCALSCDLLAVQPKKGEVNIREVASPMQGSAQDYRSSFSRAVEITLPTHRSIFISGTASIDRVGRTAHVGDVARQIELTMQVTGALLDSRGMGWGDVCRGIAYFTSLEDVGLYEQYCREHSLPEFPLALACARVCRKDLLFEIEADATTIGA
jgi:enamine deaminase RidA (YjgF/YER057c/UK114 family)